MAPTLLAEARCLVLDLETTGLAAPGESILEIGMVEVDRLAITDRWSTLVNPGRPLPAAVLSELGISRQDVLTAPPLAGIVPEITRRIAGAEVLVCHNAPFDLRVLLPALVHCGWIPVSRAVVDTLRAARDAWGRGENSLGEVAGRLGVRGDHLHRALGDAVLTAKVLMEFAAFYGDDFPLVDFPGYVGDSLVFLKPPEGRGPSLDDRGRASPSPAGMARAAEAAYRVIDAGAGGEPGQHNAVVEVLLKSALRSGREIDLVTRAPGRSLVVRRLVVRTLDGDTVAGRDVSLGREWRFRRDEIIEVRW
jgi:DNA polymerase-3 subunit epsilon